MAPPEIMKLKHTPIWVLYPALTSVRIIIVKRLKSKESKNISIQYFFFQYFNIKMCARKQNKIINSIKGFLLIQINSGPLCCRSIHGLVFVDDFSAHQSGNNILAGNFSCTWPVVSASVAFDSIVNLVASFQVVFGAEQAGLSDLVFAVCSDKDSDASFLVSVYSVFDACSSDPAVEFFGRCWALSNVLVSVNDYFLLGN